MISIAVTGASGTVGSRVVRQLAEQGRADRIVAVDRRKPARSQAAPESLAVIENHQLDLTTDDLGPAIAGCSSVVHLAEDSDRRADPQVAADALDRVLMAAEQAECGHVVLLSSALVYGAYVDNPVPLLESHPIRPMASLAHGAIKAALEARAAAWATASGARLAILRPTATLSEGDSSWIGAALRAATAVRSEQVDPPVQFLHHDDLASALVIAAEQELDSVYNVAPDGWIGAELFRALRGEPSVRLPEQLSQWRLQAAKSLANRSLLDGLEPYVTWPWVISNDKLRAVGWSPEFSNEEAFIAGTPPPLLASINPQHRQELALRVVGAAGAAAAGAALWALRRTIR
ncbi:MAG: NAD-dependent epimerase/dehydratase family protein [Acidimicrobiales bacterium]